MSERIEDCECRGCGHLYIGEFTDQGWCPGCWAKMPGVGMISLTTRPPCVRCGQLYLPTFAEQELCANCWADLSGDDE